MRSDLTHKLRRWSAPWRSDSSATEPSATDSSATEPPDTEAPVTSPRVTASLPHPSPNSPFHP
jgi:hypothetical protein